MWLKTWTCIQYWVFDVRMWHVDSLSNELVEAVQNSLKYTNKYK